MNVIFNLSIFFLKTELVQIRLISGNSWTN